MENSENKTIENEAVNTAEEKPEPENVSADKAAETAEPAAETKTEDTAEEKTEETAETKAEEKPEETVAEKAEESSETKTEEKPEETADTKTEETVAEKTEETAEAKPSAEEADTKVFQAVAADTDTKTFPAVSADSETAEKPAVETEEKTDKKEEKPKKAKTKTSPVRIVILVICLAVFAFSGYKIVMEIIDGINTDKMSGDIWETVRSDDDEFEENHDDINVPPAPIDPNVSGSGTGNTPSQETGENTENTDNQQETQGEENSQNTENSEQPPEETPDDSQQTVTPTEPSTTEPSNETEDTQEYNDRTYEEEIQEQETTPEEEDTQYYIRRPSKDKETKEIGVVIRPEEIRMSSVTYLRVSNLKSLLNINSDTVGWIYLPGSKEEAKGTPIDTAIVQTTDNDFYLDHTFDKKENANGWVYADYRCNMDSITSNYNTVIYGHARSYTMFGGLKNLNEAVEWYSDGYNHFIKINTFKDETVWQIFSWYETDIYFDYIKTDFVDSNDFIRFAYEVQRKNQMEGVFETFEFSENDRILTLSTCKGFDRAVRVAVHAKLVKRNDLTQKQ